MQIIDDLRCQRIGDWKAYGFLLDGVAFSNEEDSPLKLTQVLFRLKLSDLFRFLNWSVISPRYSKRQWEGPPQPLERREGELASH